MKRQRPVLALSVVLFMALVSNCAQSNKVVTPVPAKTPSLPTSSAISVPSLTIMPTDSPTPTYTPTAIPTLPVEEAQAKLLKLLSENGGCRLPCFWGIAPGKSSYQDVQAVLVSLSSLSRSLHLNPSGTSDVTPRLTEGDLELYNRVAFLTDPNVTVYRAAFSGEIHKPLTQGGYEDIFDSNLFGEKVSAYTLAHVLTEQGVPPSVMIQTAGGPLTRGGTGGFDILLLYPDQGILVNYKTQMHLNGTNVRGCPLNAYVQMELYPPGQPDAFFEGLKQTDWPAKMTGYKPLEETTSMSVQKFYDTFREPTEKCIETSAKLWPTPEP